MTSIDHPQASDARLHMLSGKVVDPLNVRAEDVDPEDIARVLPRLPRFNGHTLGDPISVAAHVLLVAYLAEAFPSENQPADVVKWCLAHDFHEAYFGDIPGPVRRAFGIDVAEHRAMEAVATRFGLSWPMPEAVHAFDRAALVIEWRLFRACMPLPPHYATSSFADVDRSQLFEILDRAHFPDCETTSRACLKVRMHEFGFYG